MRQTLEDFHQKKIRISKIITLLIKSRICGQLSDNIFIHQDNFKKATIKQLRNCVLSGITDKVKSQKMWVTSWIKLPTRVDQWINLSSWHFRRLKMEKIMSTFKGERNWMKTENEISPDKVRVDRISAAYKLKTPEICQWGGPLSPMWVQWEWNLAQNTQERHVFNQSLPVPRDGYKLICMFWILLDNCATKPEK